MQGSTTSSSSLRTMRTVSSSWAKAAAPESKSDSKVTLTAMDCFMSFLQCIGRFVCLRFQAGPAAPSR